MTMRHLWIPVAALLVAGMGGVAVSARHSMEDVPPAFAVETKIVASTRIENFSNDYEKELMSLRDRPAEEVSPTY